MCADGIEDKVHSDAFIRLDMLWIGSQEEPLGFREVDCAPVGCFTQLVQRISGFGFSPRDWMHRSDPSTIHTQRATSGGLVEYDGCAPSVSVG